MRHTTLAKTQQAEPAAPKPAPITAPVAATADAANNGVPSEAELLELISEAAYYRAEKRGFSPGLEHDDWLQAEAEVMARLQAMRGRP
jgi:hypothetical protein